MLVDPSVIARLGAILLEALESRPGKTVVGKAFRAMVARRGRAVERALALSAVEADETAVRARSPDHAILVDIATAQADEARWKGIELRELCLGIEA